MKKTSETRRETMIGHIGELDRLHPDMVRWRRHLHRHPELSFQERDTADFIAGRLAEWGIPVRRGFAGHAVLGVLEGVRPGPAVGLRADRDALPIQGGTTSDYASRCPGAMRACGHDARAAQLRARAIWCASRGGDLAGTRLFRCQQAEESAA